MKTAQLGRLASREVARRAALALAGPALIVTSVLVVLHRFAFSNLLTTSDVLRFWMPTYCLMGKTLAAGHIAGWNPYVMGGVPFAADPQSGWMYAPVMLLFAAFPCGTAIRWMIVLQPLLAGLGLFAFLRSEGSARPVASTGGVVLALGIAGSELSLSLPFAGTLAWTAVLLACASRFVQARTRSGRVVWCLLGALSWGQLAAAHFSIGLVMGSLLLVVYLAAKLPAASRAAGSSGWGLGIGIGFVLSLPLVNLAFLLPRLAYVPVTSLGLGYARLQDLGNQILGRPAQPFVMGGASGPGWPLSFAISPGTHLGAVALALCFAAWWSRRRRPVVVAFGAYGLLCYLLSLKVVAKLIPASVGSSRLATFYLHNPEWFGYPLVLVVAVLAAFGLEAWVEAGSNRSRVLMLAPGALVWWVLPFVFGAGLPKMVVLLAGAGAGAAVLAWIALSARRLSIAIALLPVLLAGELVASGLLGRSASRPFEPAPALLAGRSRPTVDPTAYLSAAPLLNLVQRGDGGRVVTLNHLEGIGAPEQSTTKVLIPNLSEAYGIEDVSAFNPVELVRYWVLARAVQKRRIAYNRSVFVDLPPVAEDLFQVGWIVDRSNRPPPEHGLQSVATDGVWTLYRRKHPSPRASFVGSWAVVPDAPDGFPSPALVRVLDAHFQPAKLAVLEAKPSLPKPVWHAKLGGATYRTLGPQAAEVTVRADQAGIVLIRNAFDARWHATLDGRAAPLLRTDYLFEGVAVPAGSHTIELRYDDPWIGYGLAGSGVMMGAFLLAALALAMADRRRPPVAPAPAAGGS
jgi:hypothetical protein